MENHLAVTQRGNHSMFPKPLPRTVFMTPENKSGSNKDETFGTITTRPGKEYCQRESNGFRAKLISESKKASSESLNPKDQTTSKNESETETKKLITGNKKLKKIDDYKAISYSLISLSSLNSSTEDKNASPKYVNSYVSEINSSENERDISSEDVSNNSAGNSSEDAPQNLKSTDNLKKSRKPDNNSKLTLKPPTAIKTQSPKPLSHLDKRKNKSTPCLSHKSLKNNQPTTGSNKNRRNDSGTSSSNSFKETPNRSTAVNKAYINVSGREEEGTKASSIVTGIESENTDNSFTEKKSSQAFNTQFIATSSKSTSPSSTKGNFSFSFSVVNISQKLGFGPLRKYTKYNASAKRSTKDKNDNLNTSSVFPPTSFQIENAPESNEAKTSVRDGGGGAVSKRTNLIEDNRTRELPSRHVDHLPSTSNSRYTTNNKSSSKTKANKSVFSTDRDNRRRPITPSRTSGNTTEITTSSSLRQNENSPKMQQFSSNRTRSSALINESVIPTALTQHGYSSKKIRIPLKNLSDFNNTYARIEELMINGQELLSFSKYSQACSQFEIGLKYMDCMLDVSVDHLQLTDLDKALCKSIQDSVSTARKSALEGFSDAQAGILHPKGIPPSLPKGAPPSYTDVLIQDLQNTFAGTEGLLDTTTDSYHTRGKKQIYGNTTVSENTTNGNLYCHRPKVDSPSSLSLISFVSTSAEGNYSSSEITCSDRLGFHRGNSLHEKFLNPAVSDDSKHPRGRLTHKRNPSAPQLLSNLKLSPYVTTSNEAQDGALTVADNNDRQELNSSVAFQPVVFAEGMGLSEEASPVLITKNQSKRSSIYPRLDFNAKDFIDNSQEDPEIDEYHKNAMKKLQRENEHYNRGVKQTKQSLPSVNPLQNFYAHSISALPLYTSNACLLSTGSPNSSNTQIVWSNLAMKTSSTSDPTKSTIPFQPYVSSCLSKMQELPKNDVSSAKDNVNTEEKESSEDFLSYHIEGSQRKEQEDSKTRNQGTKKEPRISNNLKITEKRIDQQPFPKPAPRTKFQRSKDSEQQNKIYKQSDSKMEGMRSVNQEFKQILIKRKKENEKVTDKNKLPFESNSASNSKIESKSTDLDMHENIYENVQSLGVYLNDKISPKYEEENSKLPASVIGSKSDFLLNDKTSIRDVPDSSKNNSVLLIKNESGKSNFSRDIEIKKSDCQYSNSAETLVLDPFISKNPFPLILNESNTKHTLQENKSCNSSDSASSSNKSESCANTSVCSAAVDQINSSTKSSEFGISTDFPLEESSKSSIPNMEKLDYVKIKATSTVNNHSDPYVVFEIPKNPVSTRRSVLREFDPLSEKVDNKLEKETKSNFINEKELQIKITENNFKSENDSKRVSDESSNKAPFTFVEKSEREKHLLNSPEKQERKNIEDETRTNNNTSAEINFPEKKSCSEINESICTDDGNSSFSACPEKSLESPSKGFNSSPTSNTLTKFESSLCKEMEENVAKMARDGMKIGRSEFYTSEKKLGIVSSSTKWKEVLKLEDIKLFFIETESCILTPNNRPTLSVLEESGGTAESDLPAIRLRVDNREGMTLWSRDLPLVTDTLIFKTVSDIFIFSEKDGFFIGVKLSSKTTFPKSFRFASYLKTYSNFEKESLERSNKESSKILKMLDDLIGEKGDQIRKDVARRSWRTIKFAKNTLSSMTDQPSSEKIYEEPKTKKQTDDFGNLQRVGRILEKVIWEKKLSYF